LAADIRPPPLAVAAPAAALGPAQATGRRRERGDRAAYTYVEVVGEEGRGEDAAVERPLVAVEADEAVALELAHDGVRLVAVERVGAREEDLR